MPQVAGWFIRAQAFFGAPMVASKDEDREYSIDHRAMALLVGVIAFFLPFALLWVSRLNGGCDYDSISHYYYSPWAGPLLVGGLFAIGAFMVGYRGMTRRENVLASLAGLGAVGVAVFPTSGGGCDEAPFTSRAFMTLDELGAPAAAPGGLFELASWTRIAHYGSAVFVFVVLAIFCLFIFTRFIRDEHFVDGRLTRAKTWRNRIYIGCGCAMVLIMLVIGLKAVGALRYDDWDKDNVTYLLESAMLILFGVSWSVKGRLGPLGRLLDDRLLDPSDLRALEAKGLRRK